MRLLDFANFDISKGDFIAMVLQTNVTFRGFSEILESFELALVNPLVPVITALDVFAIFDAIHVLFATFRSD